MADPVMPVAGALVLAVAALLTWRLRRRRRSSQGDPFRALGTDRKAAVARVAPPPVDLSKPITGDKAWHALRAHARDAAYRRADTRHRGHGRGVRARPCRR